MFFWDFAYSERLKWNIYDENDELCNSGMLLLRNRRWPVFGLNIRTKYIRKYHSPFTPL